MWQSVETFNLFNTLCLRQFFWKTKTFFKILEYRLLVESTKVKNASFPNETAISEANFKTNRIKNPKWTYHKEPSFASNYFIFWKYCFSLYCFKPLIKSWFDVPTTKMPIFVLFVNAGVLFNGDFPLWLSLIHKWNC